MPDLWLGQLLAKLTAARRAGLSTAQRNSLAARDVTEVLQLISLESDPAADAAAAAAAAALPGRQSGAEAWRQARGETGRAAAGAARQPGTPYAHAQDGTLPALFAAAGRVTGGVCRASGEHNAMVPTQVVSRLFDGCLATKWLDFGGGGEGCSAWVEYRQLPSADQQQLVVTHYDVISAEDCPERDPQDWVLEAAVSSSNDNSSSQQPKQQEAWVELHRCSGHMFSSRHQLCSFVVEPQAHVSSSRWRLRITRVAQPALANSVQLACCNLYSASSSINSVRDQLAGVVGAGASQELATLRRILTNLGQQPREPKFYKLSCKAASLRALLEQPALAAQLLSVGFRPVLSVEGEQTLVADARAEGGVSAAAQRQLAALQEAAVQQK
jgi:peptide-N4-(N-acetyl-beta-glucosaminyl)asparagine amidase